MKPRVINRLPVLSIILCVSAHAADVTAVATGDWTAGTTWSDTLPAAAGNTYTIDGFTVTSPSTSNTVTFPGDSLSIQKTGTSAGVLDIARVHSSTTQTVATTLPDITIGDGATLQFRSSNGGNHFVVGSACDITTSGNVLFNNTGGNYAGNITLNGTLSGTGLITYKTANSGSALANNRTLTLTTADSAFSGNWFVQGHSSGDDLGTLSVGASKALGSGSVTLDTRARLINSADGGLDSLSSITLAQTTSILDLNNRNWTNPAATLTVSNGTANIGTATVSIASMIQDGGIINITVGGSTNGKLALSGNADLPGGDIAVTCQGNPSGLTYDLVTYGGNLITPPFVTVGDIGRLSSSVSDGDGSNDKVTISFTGSVANLVWKGNDSVVPNDWDNNLTQNFTNGGSPDVFRKFDNVSFDGTASSFTPAIIGNLSAGTLTFDGASEYILGGSGNLTGSTSIVKNGPATLTVANTTANTFSGSVTVNGGTFTAGIASALGNAAGATTVGAGGTLNTNGLNLGAEVINVAGTGVGGNGAIVNNSATAQIQTLRFVTLTADATFGGVSRWDIRTTATLDLAGHKLTKTGANYLALVDADVTSGDIDVNGGTLAFSTTTTVNGTGTIKVNTGGAIEIAYGIVAAEFSRNIALNGGSITSVNGTNGADSAISLTADSTLGGNGGTLTLNGSITESGGARSLAKSGTSTYILSGPASNWSGGTVIDRGILRLTSNNGAGSGPITIGQTDTTGDTHALQLSGVTIGNAIESKYMWTSDYKGTITAVGGTTSTVNGAVTISPLASG